MFGLRPVETLNEFREILQGRRVPPGFVVHELVMQYIFSTWTAEKQGIATYVELNVFVAGLLFNVPGTAMVLDNFIAQAKTPEAALVRARAIMAVPHGFPQALGGLQDYVRMLHAICRSLEKHHGITAWEMPQERNLDEERAFDEHGWEPLGG